MCPTPIVIHQSIGYSAPFFFSKYLNQNSLTPRWLLIPRLLRSHGWLYPRIIVSKSHENTSKYVDTVTLFSKNLNQRSLTPRWPLTHICWGHMCDSTQGSLCPSPKGIHRCMWIQWSISQNTKCYILQTTYFIQNEWSHNLFLNTVQARLRPWAGHTHFQCHKQNYTSKLHSRQQCYT